VPNLVTGSAVANAAELAAVRSLSSPSTFLVVTLAFPVIVPGRHDRPVAVSDSDDQTTDNPCSKRHTTIIIVGSSFLPISGREAFVRCTQLPSLVADAQ